MKVLFFGQLRENLKVSEVQLDFAPVDVEALLTHLSKKNENWKMNLNSDAILVAVNQTLCDKNAKLQVQDEVAFFPPVTGG